MSRSTCVRKVHRKSVLLRHSTDTVTFKYNPNYRRNVAKGDGTGTRRRQPALRAARASQQRAPGPRRVMTLQVLRGRKELPGAGRGQLSWPGHKSRRGGFGKTTVPHSISRHISRPSKGQRDQLQLVAGNCELPPSYMLSVQRKEGVFFFPSLISSVPSGALLKTLISSKAPKV